MKVTVVFFGTNDTVPVEMAGQPMVGDAIDKIGPLNRATVISRSWLPVDGEYTLMVVVA